MQEMQHITDDVLRRAVAGLSGPRFDSHDLFQAIMRVAPQAYALELHRCADVDDPFEKLHPQIARRLAESDLNDVARTNRGTPYLFFRRTCYWVGGWVSSFRGGGAILRGRACDLDLTEHLPHDGTARCHGSRLRDDALARKELWMCRSGDMTKAQRATADVFLTALKALPKVERDAVVVRIARDKAFARDILDLALIAKRRGERSRPFRDYLTEKNAR